MDLFLDLFLRHICLNCNMQRSLIVESSINPFSVSASMSEVFCLSLVNSALSLSPCVLVVTGDGQKVSIVTLLASEIMLRSYSSVSSITILIYCQSFSLDNDAL